MLRSLIYSALALALLFSSVSCAKFTRIAPSGSREPNIGDFSYLINNNQVSKAPVYKKYIDRRKY